MLTLSGGQLGVLCRRRDVLRLGGGLAAMGLMLPRLSRPPWVGASETNAVSSGQAKSCILVYLLGGPPHLDMFDLKPEATAEVRGPFQPISTSVPGTQICEHLPRLAKLAHRYALIRSVSHRNSNHTPMIYYTLTGRVTEQPDRDNDVRPPQQADFPHLGSIISKVKRANDSLPSFVAIPEVAIRSSIDGQYKRVRMPLRGGGPGFLGSAYEPLGVNGFPGTAEAIPALALPEGVSAERFEERAAMLRLLESSSAKSEVSANNQTRQRAIMLTGSSGRGSLRIFSLDDEPPALRARYGQHRFGQSMLLARRLAAAHVPMIAIHWNEMTICDGWDTHSDNFTALQTELLPMLDQSLSTLIEDLDERGMLDETLVIVMGEFGRTPKINKDAGRDHWGDCSSTLLVGGGIRGGVVLGESDRQGAFPVADAVDPVDVQATMYHCLGIDIRQTIYDHLQRPFEISTGRVIRQVLG